MKQTRSLYAPANMIIHKFSSASLGTKVVLFKAYCTQICGCPLWIAVFKYSYNKLHVSYNDAFRLLLDEPRWYSASKLLYYTVLRRLMQWFVNWCMQFGLVFVAVITMLLTSFLIVICLIVHRLLGDDMLFIFIFKFYSFNNVYITVYIMGHDPAIEMKWNDIWGLQMYRDVKSPTNKNYTMAFHWLHVYTCV